MTKLLGPNGQPITSDRLTNKKAPKPELDERYGRWAGDESFQLLQMPGGGAIAFDTSKLTLADFRQMKGHYQINSSLSILTFMMHQTDWHIECEDKKMQAFLEENLHEVWSRLVRAKSQALWAGFSPNVLQWENDTGNRRVILNKIKDLLPETCLVNWKTIEGPARNNTAPQKFKVYDGIKQYGAPGPIPVSNSYWYPLLMQNGNYYGQRLLESAFQPWFFSTLMHLFANRYYERFGEPVPVGRAPYEDEVTIGDKRVKGNQLMGQLLQQIRNRSVVVLPNDKTQFADENTLSYDYQIEYLESQMRGADFERYMTRLDEEMSLALFTPILMMRTADVGSYNLGTQHTQVYLWMLNAILSDWAFYINRYILRPLNIYNSPRGERAAPAKIRFTKMGKVQATLLQEVVVDLFRKDKVKFNAREIGEMAGLTLEEVDLLTEETKPAEQSKPTIESQPDSSTEDRSSAAVLSRIKSRLESQVLKAYKSGNQSNTKFSIGHQKQLELALRTEGYSDAYVRSDSFLNDAQRSVDLVQQLASEVDAASLINSINLALDRQMERATAS